MGIVECVDGDVIYTKEGNTSDSYVERTYAVVGYNVYGFGFYA
jgi:predicted RNA-binding protein with PIN domain